MVELFVRVFVQASLDEAVAIAERLRRTLEDVAVRTQVVAVRPYWKISEYHELSLDVTVAAEATLALSSVTSRLATGWTEPSESEAIWNPHGGAEFVEQAVRWAHVEVVE
jgi:hypothetical protein